MYSADEVGRSTEKDTDGGRAPLCRWVEAGRGGGIGGVWKLQAKYDSQLSGTSYILRIFHELTYHMMSCARDRVRIGSTLLSTPAPGVATAASFDFLGKRPSVPVGSTPLLGLPAEGTTLLCAIEGPPRKSRRPSISDATSISSGRRHGPGMRV